MVEALNSASLLAALPFDARDARLLGDPVGCVVFVGRHKEGRVEEVVFVGQATVRPSPPSYGSRSRKPWRTGA